MASDARATMVEPILRPEDDRRWSEWMAEALAWSRTAAHRRRVDLAKREVEIAASKAKAWCVMSSGGKDSTALTHLVCTEMSMRYPVGSEKDDLDFPGEEAHLVRQAEQYGWDLHILRPPVSPQQWLWEHREELHGNTNMHSRAAGLSKACFYGVVEAFSEQYDGAFLGLRAAESKHRAKNRATHGKTYRKKAGQWICCPLGDWQGIDVYAYCAARDIELLPMYKCVALMDSDDPSRIRKSWWVSTSHAHRGAAAWLRHYYPSLYTTLSKIIPSVTRHA